MNQRGTGGEEARCSLSVKALERANSSSRSIISKTEISLKDRLRVGEGRRGHRNVTKGIIVAKGATFGKGPRDKLISSCKDKEGGLKVLPPDRN